MSEGCGYTFASAIVESNDTAVGQRQLYFALTLLARNLAGYAAVNLICEPVFAGNGLKLQHAVEILVELVLAVSYVFIMALYGLVHHIGLW